MPNSLHNLLPKSNMQTIEFDSLGQALKHFRQRYQDYFGENMSQATLSERLGKSPGSRNMISAWESDRKKPDRETLLQVAEILQLDGLEINALMQLADYKAIFLEDDKTDEGLSALVIQQAAKSGMGQALEQSGLMRQSLPVPIPTIIPEPRTEHFVGREGDKARLRERLLAHDTAAVAGMRGIGGIGKTELAIAVVREVKDEFPGGVIWLDCGPNDVHALQGRLAQALGIELRFDDLSSRFDALTLALKHRQVTLIVLDDIRRRHLADFDWLLPRMPLCSVLVTSRRDDLPLPVQAIRALDVLSPEQGVVLLSELLAEEAIVADASGEGKIAELLEYIPLALMLAARRAGRLKKFTEQPLAMLLKELTTRRRIRVIDGGERPDMSVVITFDASFDDLEAVDQQRLAQLGVFARNEFVLSAIQVVWQIDMEEAQATLSRLGYAGLLEAVQVEQWWMHDLLREYAGERLSKTDDSVKLGTQLTYARYWKEVIDDIELLSVADWQLLAYYQPEIEQSANWLLAEWRHDPGLAAEYVVEISQIWQSYTFSQWENWLQQGVEAAEAAELPNAVRRLQRSLGEYYQWQGDMVQAEEYLRGSLATAVSLLTQARDQKDPEGIDDGQRGVAVTQSSLADLLSNRGQYDEAERLYRESLAVFEEIGDSRGVAVTQSSLADLLRTRGQYACLR